MDPWQVELVVVHRGSFVGAERRALSRDVARDRYVRVRPGVWLDSRIRRAMAGDPDGLHVLAMRALAAVTDGPLVFSHWSAALAHELPIVGAHRAKVHVTVPAQELRSGVGVAGHVFALTEAEVVKVHGLLVTDVARTVVDIACAAPFHEEVVTADGALADHLARALLDQAIDLVGPRRAGGRMQDVVDFAHPGGESAAESETRVTCFVLGVEPPVLQQRFSDVKGFIGRSDVHWPDVRAIGEVDGAKKYLDERYTGRGAGRVVYDEKLREDRMRAKADGFARWGFAESVRPALLLPVLERINVRPLLNRPRISDYAAVARGARSSRPRRR